MGSRAHPLISELGLSRKYVKDIFAEACEFRLLDVAKWVAEVYCLTTEEVWDTDAYHKACRRGDTMMMKWLSEAYQFEGDTLEVHMQAYREACREGDTMTVKVLSETLQDWDDMLEGFREACMAQKLELAKWMFQRFQITEDDLDDWDPPICWAGTIDMLEWVAQTFPTSTTKDEVLPVLRSMISKGDDLSCKFLVERYNLSPLEVLLALDGFNRRQCDNGGVDPLFKIYPIGLLHRLQEKGFDTPNGLCEAAPQ